MLLDIQLELDPSTNLPREDVKKSEYKPSEKESDMLELVIKNFQEGYEVMNMPRHEFNDLSVVSRSQRDQLTFNTFTSNDGINEPGIDSWKSNAIRPIARNKAISIAAHVTSRLLFPQIFAQNDNAEEDQDAAQVMRLLMEWAADQSDYEKTQVYAAIAALVNPAAIVHTEYAEIYDVDKDGEKTLNEEMSGFKDTLVPVEELFIENFYEHDIQKQGFLLWRRVISYDLAKRKYAGKYEKFKYVKPGLQVVFYPPTNTFYEQYDQNLAGNLVEEIIYWNKSLNCRVVLVNGVMLTEYDAKNPRVDKKYPFYKFGYELIDEGKCFYYKSLIFKMAPDTRIINTLYSMIIDGTYLNLFPAMVVQGDEEITSDIIVPGAVTTFENPNSKITPILSGQNMNAGLQASSLVESSIVNTSSSAEAQGVPVRKRQTAQEVETLQQNAMIQLGLFARMISFAVKDFGRLRVSDIIQYMTVGQVVGLSSEQGALKFRNFLLQDQEVDGRVGTIKVEFTLDTPTSDGEVRIREREILKREGIDNNKRIIQVNPYLFRHLKYVIKITPDLVTQPSDAVKKALSLEAYDRAIKNPLANQELVTRDLLFKVFPQTSDDPDKYINKTPMQPIGGPEPSGLQSPELQGIAQKV